MGEYTGSAYSCRTLTTQSTPKQKVSRTLLPPEMIGVFAPFVQLFSARVWLHAQVLVLGAILASGERTVSSCLRVMGLAWEGHFTNSQRVLNRAQWAILQTSKILLGLLVRVMVPPGATIVLGADDTVERRSGRQLKAKGGYLDAGRSSRQHVVKSFGALVKNGDGIEYGVMLTEALTACSCKDSLYRGGICKHGVAVALHVLRTSQLKTAALVPQFPTFHLMWRDGIVLCGEPQPERVHVWPWTEYMLTWPEVCPACVAAYKQPKAAMAKAA